MNNIRVVNSSSTQINSDSITKATSRPQVRTPQTTSTTQGSLEMPVKNAIWPANLLYRQAAISAGQGNTNTRKRTRPEEGGFVKQKKSRVESWKRSQISISERRRAVAKKSVARAKPKTVFQIRKDEYIKALEVYNSNDSNQKAIEQFNNVLSLIRESRGDGAIKLRIDVYKNLALAYYDEQQYSKAYDSAETALNIVTDNYGLIVSYNVTASLESVKTNAKLLLNNVDQRNGTTSTQTLSAEQQEEESFESIEIIDDEDSTEIDFDLNVPYAHSGVRPDLLKGARKLYDEGYELYNAKDYNSAREKLGEALNLLDEVEDSDESIVLKANALGALGLVLDQLKKCDAAGELFNKAVALVEANRDKFPDVEESGILLNRADHYHAMNENEKAISDYQKATGIIVQSRVYQQAMHATEMLKQLNQSSVQK